MRQRRGLMIAAATANPGVLKTAGPSAVVHVLDALAKPAVDVLASIVPVQSGSGDPTPSNVRPISGFTGVTVSRSGADTSNPTTFSLSWQSEAGTVYGGTIDLTTGVLTVKTKKVSITSFQGKWNISNPNGSAFYKTISDTTHNTYEAARPLLVSNIMKYNLKANSSMPLYSYGANSGGTSVHTFVLPDTVTDLSGASAWLADNPLEATFQLATYIEKQLTPKEIALLLGENNIWANTGNVTLQYYGTA